MKITDVSKVIPGPNPHHVDARKVYDSPYAMAVVFTPQPGESLRRHITPVDVFFYVLEGTGIVEMGMRRKPLGKTCLSKVRPGSLTHGPTRAPEFSGCSWSRSPNRWKRRSCSNLKAALF